MTLDEAIKHAEEVAEEKQLKAHNLKLCKDYGNPKSTITSGVVECETCADEHRQLAEWLKELKRLKEQTRWIPVSEKLPKEGETVLVCYRTQGGVAQSACEWFDMPNRGIVWSTLCGNTPIAWMPLPEPYEEGVERE